MLREKLFSISRIILFAAGLFFPGCNSPFTGQAEETVSFMVIDVGQGLSQILLYADRALLFDTGPSSAEKMWRSVYDSLGKPRLDAILLSHRDPDYSGGLEYMDRSINWSGRLITSTLEDTLLLKNKCKEWTGDITCEMFEAGDTMHLTQECHVKCLWPLHDTLPERPVPDQNVNNYSMVCAIMFRNSRILLTGGIDSTAGKTLSQLYGTELRADLFVVPHHGSAGSACPLFFSLVRPQVAVVSSGNDNRYGHPADETIQLLAQLGIPCKNTADDGSLAWKSNGFYWVACF